MGFFGPTLGLTVKGTVLTVVGGLAGVLLGALLLLVAPHIPPWLLYLFFALVSVILYVSKASTAVRVLGISGNYVYAVPVLGSWTLASPSARIEVWHTEKWTLLGFCLIAPVLVLILISIPPVATEQRKLKATGRSILLSLAECLVILRDRYETVDLTPEETEEREFLELHPAVILPAISGSAEEKAQLEAERKAQEEALRNKNNSTTTTTDTSTTTTSDYDGVWSPGSSGPTSDDDDDDEDGGDDSESTTGSSSDSSTTSSSSNTRPKRSKHASSSSSSSSSTASTADVVVASVSTPAVAAGVPGPVQPPLPLPAPPPQALVPSKSMRDRRNSLMFKKTGDSLEEAPIWIRNMQVLSRKLDLLSAQIDSLGPMSVFAQYEPFPQGFSPRAWAALRVDLLKLKDTILTLRLELYPRVRFGVHLWTLYCAPLLQQTLGSFDSLAHHISLMANVANGTSFDFLDETSQGIAKSTQNLRLALLRLHTLPSAYTPVEPRQLFALFSIIASIASASEHATHLSSSLRGAISNKPPASRALSLLRSLFVIVWHPIRSFLLGYRRIAISVYRAFSGRGGEGLSVLANSLPVRDALKYMAGVLLCTFPFFVESYRPFLLQHHAWWVFITYIFVYNPEADDSIRLFLERTAAFVVYCAAGLIALIVHVTVKDAGGAGVLIFAWRALWMALGVYWIRRRSPGYAGWFTLFILDTLILCDWTTPGRTVLGVVKGSVARAVCCAAGSTLAFFVGYFVYPARALTVMRTELGAAISTTADMLAEVAMGYVAGPGPSLPINWDRVNALHTRATISMEDVNRRLLARPVPFGPNSPLDEYVDIREMYASARTMLSLVHSLVTSLGGLRASADSPATAAAAAAAAEGEIVEMLESLDDANPSGAYSAKAHQAYVTPLRCEYKDVIDLTLLGMRSLAVHLGSNTQPADLEIPSIEQRIFTTLIDRFAQIRDLRYLPRPGYVPPPRLPLGDFIRLAVFTNGLGRLTEVLPIARNGASKLCSRTKTATVDAELHNILL